MASGWISPVARTMLGGAALLRVGLVRGLCLCLAIMAGTVAISSQDAGAQEPPMPVEGVVGGELAARAAGGDLAAQLELAASLAAKTDDPSSIEESVAWFRAAAESGSAEAQSALGLIYVEGRGVSADAVEGARWFRRAAEQGDSRGQMNVGLAYYSGTGVPQDYVEAARWLQLAADQGVAQAQTVLGFLYLYGMGVPKDFDIAQRWLVAASEQSYANAELLLGDIQYTGYGVPANANAAWAWYKRAASHGSAEAETKLQEFEWPAVSPAPQPDPITPSAGGSSSPASTDEPEPSSSPIASAMNEIMLSIGLIALITVGIVFAFFAIKLASRCPQCSADWAWKIISSVDDPRGTFQERARTGESRSGGQHVGYIYTVTTFENGLRTSVYACNKCRHSQTKKSSYKKRINTHTETV